MNDRTSDETLFDIQVVGNDGKILQTIQLPQSVTPPREWESKGIESGEAAIQEYIEAVKEGCPEHMYFADRALSEFRVWEAVYDRLRDLDLDARLKQAFLEHWRHRGGPIRRGVFNDELLLAVLSRLLPGYSGSALVLFRGETDANIGTQSYGPSWTTKLAKAAEFARSEWQGPDPSSVIATIANPEAILAEPNDASKDHGEFEYVVDRRRLTSEVFTLTGCAWSGSDAINKAAVALDDALAGTATNDPAQVERLCATLRDWATAHGYLA